MFDEKRKEEILKLLKTKNAKKVLLQIPEGLKQGVQDLMDFLESNNLETYLSIEQCFGACDIRDREAEMLGCDTILHIGHADFGVETKIPVVYYVYDINADFASYVKKHMGAIKRFKKICLVTTVQFVKNLNDVKHFLEKNDFKVYVSDYILGCDVTNAKKFERFVDAFLFIGSGRFHPLGLQETIEKPVLFLDIENDEIENLKEMRKKNEIKRGLRIEKARDMKTFCILISSKQGQFRKRQAEQIRKYLISKGKEVYIFIADRITPDKLMGLRCDILVNTACPRIREDAEQFGKIILNPDDVYEL